MKWKWLILHLVKKWKCFLVNLMRKLKWFLVNLIRKLNWFLVNKINKLNLFLVYLIRKFKLFLVNLMAGTLPAGWRRKQLHFWILRSKGATTKFLFYISSICLFVVWEYSWRKRVFQGHIFHVWLFGKDRLQLNYEPRRADFKVQLVYIVCRWITNWCQETEQHNSRGHDGSFQAPGGSTYSLESGVKRLQIAGQVLQTVMAETMQVPMTKLIFMTNLDADLCGLGTS